MALKNHMEGVMKRASLPIRRVSKSKTANYTVGLGDTGTAFDNEAAAGSVTFTLPTGTIAKGIIYVFSVKEAQTVAVNPGAAGAFYVGGAKQSDDSDLSSNDIGDSITVISDGDGDWMVLSREGSWGFATVMSGALTIDTTLAVTGESSFTGQINVTDGGTVTQTGSDSTTVVRNALTGEIQTVSLTLAAGADTSFTLTNSTIGADDAVLVWGKVYGGTTDGIISVQVEEVAAGSCVLNIQNIGGASLDAICKVGFMVLGGSVT